MPLRRRSFLAASALAAPLVTAGAAAPALAGQPAPQGRRVTPGADSLAAQGWRSLAGRKVGVLSNPTGLLMDGTHIVDSMVAAGVRPVAAFGPEHGFRGTGQAGGSEGDYIDPRTGVPVYDAYGVTAAKLAGMYRKAGVDTVVFDIADVGARFYTYIWSLYRAMQAAVMVGASFVVLDRPNPVGGQAFGPTLDPAFASGVGLKPIVQQHGMTIGELARFYNGEFLPSDGGVVSTLDITQLTGWKRRELFGETGLPWAPPSPNMPTADTAILYPGTCLFEGLRLSEGRGTTRPFEIVGAPGMDWHWEEALNALRLPGVQFREAYFVPTFGKFVNETCGGVHAHITDRYAVDPIRTAIAMIVTARQAHPQQFGWRQDNFIDKLYGSDRLRRMVDAGAGVDEIVGSWQGEQDTFRRQREQYLIYR
ncbi:uncharacterized protein YbbC (DUF1343 family) [Herbihabitans rhizosphaerae]|uniref:Uncharacterized protein YbbC (DUF1343 family) n=1 Tax=Herbihabitans rhizosphaerae TaxID=1872711 RepID=A0A4Q7KWV2_9PSEU|nr:DUF1343 domain-containing protein [Herbihabitans rhizosphaerae]RZS41264.1 uncharacterized protein YbbC (DUF1343 family) [Herbihabitans rhizosphaerae]